MNALRALVLTLLLLALFALWLCIGLLAGLIHWAATATERQIETLEKWGGCSR